MNTLLTKFAQFNILLLSNAYNMDIGSRITELRKAKNWSQTDLAKEISVSRVIIGRYERDEAAPSIDIAKKMADAFGVSLDYLVGEGQNASFDKRTVQRLQDITNLPENERNCILLTLDHFIKASKISLL